MAGLIPLKYSDDEIRAVREAAAQGESDESIAARFGMHIEYVRQVRAGRCRKRAGGPITRRSVRSPLARRVARLERDVARLERALGARAD